MNPPNRLTSLLAYPLRHVRGRIVLPFALLTVLLAGAGSYLVTNVVSGSLRERFDNQLVEAGRAASDELVHIEQDQLQNVRAMSATQGVSAALISADDERLESMVAPLARNSDVDWVGAIDSNGQLRFGLARESDGAYVPVGESAAAQWWPVTQALSGADARGDKYASLVETSRGFVLLTAAPVHQEGRVVGGVLTGTYATTIVEQLKERVRGDVTLYDYTGEPIASTLGRSAVEAGQLGSLQISGVQLTSIIGSPDTTQRSQIQHNNRPFDVAYGQLRIRGNVIGVYSVALSSDYLGAAGRTTRFEMSMFVAIAVTAVVLIGFFISRRITGPILDLVAAARRLSTGDLTARTDVRSSDEIGVLANAFDQMAESLQEYSARIQRQYVGTVKALTTAIDARDPYTLGHSLRVGQLGRTLGAQMGLPESLLNEIEIGGYLHDIGKIGVRDEVLLKTGPLTPTERDAIQRHPEIGISILASVELSAEACDIVRGHHERLDGSGYPDGLAGDDVSIVARIAAVADVYDALMTDRPYKAAMDIADVRNILSREAGVQYDRRVVEAMLAVAPAWEERVRSDPTLRGFGIGEVPLPDVRRVA